MTTKSGGTSGKRPRREKTLPNPYSSEGQPLSLTLIVLAAVEVLDAEGLEGLTMRKLAHRLGAGAMSLYWYVGNKDAVLDLALDAALDYRGPLPKAEPSDWRAEIVDLLTDWRTCMLRHPWSAALLPRRNLGPNMLNRLELLSRILSTAGLEETDLNPVIWSLWNHVMGATLTRASFDFSDQDLAEAQQRLTDLRESYPTIERTRLLLDNDWDGAFLKGLGFLLDGLPLR